MVISQGEIWWADLGIPRGSAPALYRPVVIVQSDHFNRSKIATVVCAPLTTNIGHGQIPGNVLLPARWTGLSKDSVVNASQIITIDKSHLHERVGKLPRAKLELVFTGIDVVLGR